MSANWNKHAQIIFTNTTGSSCSEIKSAIQIILDFVKWYDMVEVQLNAEVHSSFATIYINPVITVIQIRLARVEWGSYLIYVAWVLQKVRVSLEKIFYESDTLRVEEKKCHVNFFCFFNTVFNALRSKMSRFKGRFVFERYFLSYLFHILRHHKLVETFHNASECMTAVYFEKCLVHSLAYWPRYFDR